MAWLRRLYGRSTAVVLVESAVAAAPGTAILRHDPRNPTVSTLSDEWIHAVRRDASFDKVRWRAAETVSVTTLDALIAAHGTPIVCKIDIEGYEAEALFSASMSWETKSGDTETRETTIPRRPSASMRVKSIVNSWAVWLTAAKLAQTPGIISWDMMISRSWAPSWAPPPRGCCAPTGG